MRLYEIERNEEIVLEIQEIQRHWPKPTFGIAEYLLPLTRDDAHGLAKGTSGQCTRMISRLLGHARAGSDEHMVLSYLASLPDDAWKRLRNDTGDAFFDIERKFRKICPQCAELVKTAASVCRYCDHQFDR